MCYISCFADESDDEHLHSHTLLFWQLTVMVNDSMVFSKSILASDTPSSSSVTFVLTVLATVDLPPQDSFSSTSSSPYYSVVVNPSYCKGEEISVVGFNNTFYDFLSIEDDLYIHKLLRYPVIGEFRGCSHLQTVPQSSTSTEGDCFWH